MRIRGFLLILVLTIVLSPLAAAAQTNVWISNGPGGRDEVTSLAIDPANSSVLFAGTGSGVYKSVDGGASWAAASSGLPPAGVSGLAMDPHDSSRLYAWGYTLYVSTNGGGSWSILAMLSDRLSEFVIDPANTKVLYAAVRNKVYKSADQGSTWTAILSSPYGSPGDFQVLALDPAHPGTIYAGELANYYDSGGVLHKSTDGGATWRDTGLFKNITCLAIDPLSPNILYAGAALSVHHGAVVVPAGFFKSLDGGATWTEILANGTHQYFSSLQFHPFVPTELYATNGRLVRSLDGGATWTDVSPDAGFLQTPQSVVFDPTTPSTFYATAPAGLLKSVDRGIHWAEINIQRRYAQISAIAVDPSGPDTVYAGSVYGEVSVTTDGGATWQRRGVVPSGGAVYTLLVDPASPSTIYAGDLKGLFKSTDRASTWVALDALPQYVTSLVIDVRDHLTLLAASEGEHLSRSTDGGASWQPISLPSLSVSLLVADPVSPHGFYAVMNSPVVRDGGLYKTSDSGSTWTRVSDLYGSALAADPVNPSVLYMGGASITYPLEGFNLYRSIDGGKNWSLLYHETDYSLFVSQLTVHPVRPSLLYVLKSTGVAASVDGGVSWWDFGGLPRPGSLVSNRSLFAVNPLNPDVAYVGSSSGGVYRLELSKDVGPSAPVIAEQPQSATIGTTPGLTVHFTVSATGRPVPSYQWQLSTNGGGWWTDISNSAYSGVRTSRLTVTMGTSGRSTMFRCLVSNVAGSKTSDAVSLTIYGVTATPSTLYFNGSINRDRTAISALTRPQDVWVSGVGTGAAWTATTDAPWLIIIGGSGTGTGRFTVSIDPTNLPPEFSTPSPGTIRIAASTPTSSTTVPVRFSYTDPVRYWSSLYPQTQGWFDTPSEGATNLQGSIAVSGWALDTIGIDRVEIWRDLVDGETTPPYYGPEHPGHGKVYIGNAVFVDASRPDVEYLYGTYPFARRAGWGYLLLSHGLWSQGNGTYKLSAFAFSVDDRATVLGTKTITVDNANATQPFGAIDTPGQGETVSGSFYNYGWALTPVASPTCSMRGGTVQMAIDSGPLQPVMYGDNRPDVAAAFPGLPDSINASGAVWLDTTTLTNGLHQIGWLVTDSCGRQDGVGSRFFNVLNTEAAPARTAQDVAGAAGRPSMSVGASVPGQNTRQTMTRRPGNRDPGTVSRQRASTIATWQIGPWAGMVTARTGFGPRATLEPLVPGDDGVRHVQIGQLSRLELHIGPGIEAGYLEANGTRRDLPVGSRFDPTTGIFTWMPAPGYFGTYNLVFLRDGEEIRIAVAITGGEQRH